MKRSEINQIIREAEDFFAANNFHLPAFASWSEADWRQNATCSQEIFDCKLGWDVTDFGQGDFKKEGLTLFTVRNGIAGSTFYPKAYAEKLMISREGQMTLMHCHVNKREDIINRGGGTLVFELGIRADDGSFTGEAVSVSRDGVRETVASRGTIELAPGESITLEPNVYHAFYATGGDVLIGEVSSVNDDETDNLYYEPQLRFPKIEEDEAIYRMLVTDYKKLF